MTIVTELDALIVGAGFGGVWQLHKLRQEGHRVRLVESGDDFGGVWYWNRYPGARVDSSIPHYEFSLPELWSQWTWKERFPDWSQLQAYFAFVADKLDLRRDAQFNTTVTQAVFSDSDSRWTVRTDTGEVFRVKFLLLNVGFAAKRYIPDFPGLDRFKGTWVHPSYWPKDGLDLAGKRVAVIGTGSTGIQLSHEISKVAAQLAVFQRTPNLALPMRQEHYAGDEQIAPKSSYPSIYDMRTKSYSGFDFNFLPRGTFDDTPEQRRQTYEELWKKGDFEYWLATYKDMLFDAAANKEAYDFWRDKTRARIRDPALHEKLAPEVQPHAFGCKRISLENGYFEIFNQDNVRLVDVNATPIAEVTERGIRIGHGDGELLEFDCIILATGYDAITGGLTQIDIRGPAGPSLADKWQQKGASTFLGISSAGFPNMFFTYGPQAPTALCNGPTCAELQGNWIAAVMRHMQEKGLQRIDATPESEEEYVKLVNDIAYTTLLPGTKSWYMGDNIPGKKRQPLLYLAGVHTYYARLNDCAAAGYSGFQLK
ncbi:putative cyclopentanone -monooxygenase protein [Neofusicoccum parvum UCRNP2]|uniref:Putative cyclopentanone-monooxygenase protein n=1 Tax=Botryosphaeria parva (strain UCR-NP2) TaxID=1287680 RepID=R1GJV6_BOTPV|nr:putative cyclopentanone -monooxygenase protein [Neofusicoccum parvum UCRNP2]